MATKTKTTKAAPASNSNGNAGQTVTFGEYNGKPIFQVSNAGFDKFPTQLGARKVRDVVGNIERALEFLSNSTDERDVAALRRFNSMFKAK